MLPLGRTSSGSASSAAAAPPRCAAAVAALLPTLAERALPLPGAPEQRQFLTEVVAGAARGFRGALERRATAAVGFLDPLSSPEAVVRLA